ncbi:MAG: hypothetical protein AAGF67_06865 [Verrucomicrobiota bacterium]
MKSHVSRSITLILAIFGTSLLVWDLPAQKRQKDRTKNAATRADYQLPPSPLPVGEAGIMWYTTWETAMAEARRSNRPLFFMAAAAECSGISGIF